MTLQVVRLEPPAGRTLPAATRLDPFAIEPRDPESFRARIDHRRLRDCTIASLSAEPATLVIRPGKAEAGMLGLLVVTGGRMHVTAIDRSFALGPGDFCALDCSQPARLAFSAPSSFAFLQMSRAAAEGRVPGIGARIATALDGSHGPRRLFASVVIDAARHSASGADWLDGLSDAVLPLLRAALAQGTGAPAPAGRSDKHRRLFELIKDNLGNPVLDANWVARRIGVSARYVQMLMADLGTTPREFIRVSRLEEAARRLAGSQEAHGISDIAEEFGFSSHSSFSRQFKKQYGVSPSQYRQGERSGMALRAAA